MIASFGFFFLPLIQLKPNRIASGVSFSLLQPHGDARHMILFLTAVVPLVIVAIAPLVVAMYSDRGRRGWLLVGLGHLLVYLTLLLPALAGEQLIGEAATILPEDVQLRNPRILPLGAIALGILGGVIVVFGGLRDLEREEVSRMARLIATWLSIPFIILLFVSGSLDIYSVMVEYYNNGDLLGERLIEHITFVLVSLTVGTTIGIGFGLWASRDERMAPIILYTVGIIQTIPSLALFGVLLVPLARLGDQRFLSVLPVFAILLFIAAVFVVLFLRVFDRVPERAQTPATIVGALAISLPLVLFTVILVSFLFRVSLLALMRDAYQTNRSVVLVLIALALGAMMANRWLVKASNVRLKRILRYGAAALGGAIILTVIVTLVQSSQEFLRFVESVETLTIRDLGVSGIRTAPALIALTLYSLLPIVRNTYAGLNNVDLAIIDSGRGMGMTPPQIFFQIELPLAFPVIMAGVRNAAVALVGIGVIATVIGAGGLGDFIMQGILNISIDLILLGAIPAVFLAIALDAGLRAFEAVLTSPGIRQTQDVQEL